MEAYGDKIKMRKYYYGATLFMYEFVGFLSMFTYIYTLFNVSSTEKWSFGKYPFVELSYFLPIGLILCAHWIKNTFVHISLFQCKMYEVSEDKTTIVS